jgi:dienelactone hydrolase
MLERIVQCLGVVGMTMIMGASSAIAESDDADASKTMPTVPMREQVLHVPGDPQRPVMLEATLFEPPGDGPFPLAVMNHGAKGDPRTNKRYRVSFSIDYLLSRGYAVVAPMMRGFAESGGKAVNTGCDLARLGKLNAQDILGAISAMRSRPEIDGSRVLIVGQSFGGWNSLAFATMAPPEVKGVINFVGGVRSSDCANQDDALFDGMAQFGRKARLPSLWFYGEGDTYFPERIWRKDYDRFTRAGGKARLVNFGEINDAHNLLGQSEYLNLWIPEVDAYLGERRLPNKQVFPEFLPAPCPSPTNYASIGDIAAVPFVGRTQPEFYQKFLSTTDRPRALVVSPKAGSFQSGGFDPVARALADCATHGSPCSLYAYDDKVVWTGPPVGQTARIDGALILGKAAKAGAVEKVQQFVALTPSCAPLPLPAVAVASPPAHGTTDVAQIEDFPEFAPQNPLSTCSAHKVPMLRITYKGASDFIGVDFLAISVTEANKPPRTIKYAMHVN